MKKIHLILLILTAMSISISAQVRGEDEIIDTKSLNAEKGVKIEGLKLDEINTVNDKSAPQVEEKSMAKRSHTKVIAVNNTNLWVKIYSDGKYRGTAAPYGEVRFKEYATSSDFYARADYGDGSYRYWGPEYKKLKKIGKFTWNLYY